MPQHIIDLYLYFLYRGTKKPIEVGKSRKAFERFYDADNSREWVRRYAIRGGWFYAEFMSKYSKEIRELNKKPFDGIITPRGVFK